MISSPWNHCTIATVHGSEAHLRARAPRIWLRNELREVFDSSSGTSGCSEHCGNGTRHEQSEFQDLIVEQNHGGGLRWDDRWPSLRYWSDDDLVGLGLSALERFGGFCVV